MKVIYPKKRGKPIIFKLNNKEFEDHKQFLKDQALEQKRIKAFNKRHAEDIGRLWYDWLFGGI